MATIIEVAVRVITASSGFNSASVEVIDTQYYTTLDDFHDGIEQMKDLGEYFDENGK